MSQAADGSHIVHVGRDGWLFLAGGNNNPLLLYRRSWRRLRLLLAWWRLLRARARRSRALGIRYLHLAVPEKTGVYGDKLDGLDVDPGLGLVRPLSRLLPRHCPDLAAGLEDGRQSGETFIRVDTHWTSEGCRIAHDLVCREVGAGLRWRLEERPVQTFPDYQGDLGSKLDPPSAMQTTFRLVLRDAVRVHVNPLLARAEQLGRSNVLHQGAHVVYRNEAADADPRRVLLFGDSYSSHAGTGLTAMLAETFRELHFIWSPEIDWNYVQRVKPDVLLTQIAERFKMVVPSVAEPFDIDVFSAARLDQLETST